MTSLPDSESITRLTLTTTTTSRKDLSSVPLPKNSIISLNHKEGGTFLLSAWLIPVLLTTLSFLLTDAAASVLLFSMPFKGS
jgi:hypothetical protein